MLFVSFAAERQPHGNMSWHYVMTASTTGLFVAAGLPPCSQVLLRDVMRPGFVLWPEQPCLCSMQLSTAAMRAT
jgi:hypothetical protein